MIVSMGMSEWGRYGSERIWDREVMAMGGYGSHVPVFESNISSISISSKMSNLTTSILFRDEKTYCIDRDRIPARGSRRR